MRTPMGRLFTPDDQLDLLTNFQRTLENFLKQARRENDLEKTRESVRSDCNEGHSELPIKS